jgi:hypothetical protein
MSCHFFSVSFSPFNTFNVLMHSFFSSLFCKIARVNNNNIFFTIN